MNSKTRFPLYSAQAQTRRIQSGSSLVLVLVVTAAGIAVVAGILSWIATTNKLTQRVNQYEACLAAAGAATEKVICRIVRDFETSDYRGVSNNIGTYRALVPSNDDLISIARGWVIATDNPHRPDWGNYEFSDAQGNVGQTYVGTVCPWTYTNISSRFPGLSGFCSRYRVISNVRDVASTFNTPSGVKQEVVIASIPVFQFQVFYTSDLEINPVSSALTLNGRVHCNGTIYSQPGVSVTFQAPVTASRSILRQKHPLDPTIRSGTQVNFQAGYEAGLNTLNPVFGTNVSPWAFRPMLDIPPVTELIASPLGQQRLYNKADLIILVSNNTAVAKSGAYNGFSVKIPWTNVSEVVIGNTWYKGKGLGPSKGRGKKAQEGLTNTYEGIVATNMTFFDARANKYVSCTDIDLTQLLAQYSYFTTNLGRPLRTLYVADMRTSTATTQPGIRVAYGETLPSGGLTIVTPNPLYVVGDYNVTPAGLGTTNTTGTSPAALIADSITLLSGAWYDDNGVLPVTARNATNTTVNAGLVAGIVPTGGGYYSGGLENLLRLLEDWTGKTLTMNGSLVCLYPSQIATAPWGASPDVSKPPIRKWSFDPRFNGPAGLPPGTPEVRAIIRHSQQTVQANRVN